MISSSKKFPWTNDYLRPETWNLKLLDSETTLMEMAQNTPFSQIAPKPTPDLERTNQSTGICLRLGLPCNNNLYLSKSREPNILMKIGALKIWGVWNSLTKLCTTGIRKNIFVVCKKTLALLLSKLNNLCLGLHYMKMLCNKLTPMPSGMRILSPHILVCSMSPVVIVCKKAKNFCQACQ